jgi:dienelactone hydrolase
MSQGDICKLDSYLVYSLRLSRVFQRGKFAAMRSSRLCFVLLYLILCASFAAEPVFVLIPTISGPLAIDGKLDDAVWQGARAFSLTSPEFSSPFPAGGEIRIATRGVYLCVSARIPEPDRIVAHSTGRNPNWWQEDLITWNIRVQDSAARRHPNLSFTVNALGAYRVQGASGMESLEGEKVLVASKMGAKEWTVEAAIPLERFGTIGFIDVQRTRAPRPDAPELHWYWPAMNERATFQLSALSSDPVADFRVVELRSQNTPPPKSRAALARIPRNVWTEAQHDQLQVSRMLSSSQRSRMSVVANEEKRAWQQVNSREAWEHFRDPRLDALRKSIGPMPARTPLDAVVTRRANLGDGFVIRNLVYKSRPGLLVTANLYTPEKPSGKIPAVVVIHSHHAPKTQFELQDLGMTWARAGTAVLVMDQLCAGERSQSEPWPRESYYGRYALGNQLLLAGESIMKWMVWDLMRSIDFLLEQPEIDPQRIVLLGAVAGGGDPAAVTAALDSRVAAVIPFNFGEAGPEEHYTEGPRGYDFETAWPGWGEWETSRCLPHSSVDQFFPWLICASVAPRPFLFSFEIGWPEDVEHEPIWARYKKVFALYGARDHLSEVHGFGPYPGPGEVTNIGTLLQKRIDPILQEWLHVTPPAAEYHNPRPDSELMCLTPAVAAESKPKPAAAILLDLTRERLALARSKLSALPERDRLNTLRIALKNKLGDIEPLESPSVHRVWEKSSEEATVEAFTIETEPGITLPVLLLKPPQSALVPAPAILALAEGGKQQFLDGRAEDIVTLLQNGIAVCLPDVRGTGEIAPTKARGPGAMGPAATEFMLGGTLPGARLKDARTIFRYLASRPDLDPARILVWGDSLADVNPDNFTFDQSDMQEPGPFAQYQAEPMGALLALLTGLYEDRVMAVAGRGGVLSFLSAIEDRFCHIPQDVIVPGILEVADIADIVAAQKSRPLLLERLVNGRNQVAPQGRLEFEFAGPLKTSRNLIVRYTSGEPALSSWLVDECRRKRM